VTAKDGVVTLTGHVATYSEKSAAEKAARRIKDVKAVAEEIEVRLPIDVQHGDEEIALAAVNRLAWDSEIPADSVKVRVEQGWVTLIGEVDWHYQQQAAANDVRGLWGVLGVSNQIILKTKPNSAKIRDDILRALDRSWFDRSTIHVSAEGGKVTLSGNVGTWHERDQAYATAWAASGTTSVDNEISVI
jgi:osmotically-inducible protein OsmY